MPEEPDSEAASIGADAETREAVVEGRFRLRRAAWGALVVAALVCALPLAAPRVGWILMLRSAPARFRIHAIAALARMGGEAEAIAIGLECDEESVRRAAIKALAASGASGAVHLARAMGDEDKELRTLARDGLVKLGKVAVEPLAELTRDPDPVLRHEAWTALAAVGTPAVPVMIEAIGAPRDETRRLAILALSKVGGAARQAVPELIALLGRDRLDSEGEREALNLLAVIGPGARSGRPLIASRLTDRRLLVRAAAGRAWAATTPKDGAGLDRLRAPLSQDSPYVRLQIVKGLERLGPKAETLRPELMTCLDIPDKALGKAVRALLARFPKD